MSELKACPFCGGDSFMLKTTVHGYKYFLIECATDNCAGAMMDETAYATEEEVILKWNTRAQPFKPGVI